MAVPLGGGGGGGGGGGSEVLLVAVPLGSVPWLLPTRAASMG